MNPLKEEILFEEGFYPNVYKDHLGYPTVGIGFLVSSLTKDEISLNGGKLEPMSKEVAFKILDLKLSKLIPEVFNALPWLKEKHPYIQNVLIEMAYQMGIKGLLSFKNTLKMIEESRYQEAAENMLKSKWAKQTPNRARRKAKIIASF